MDIPGWDAIAQQIKRLMLVNQDSPDTLFEISRSLHDLAKDINAFATERFHVSKMGRKESGYLKRSTRAALMFRKLLAGQKSAELAAEFGISATLISQEISALACDLKYRATHGNLCLDVRPFEDCSVKSIREDPDSWNAVLDVFEKELALRANGKSESEVIKSLWGIDPE
jgi:hypothetical protein